MEVGGEGGGGGAVGGSPEWRLVAESLDSCCEDCTSSVLCSVSPGSLVRTLRERGGGGRGEVGEE